MIHICVHRTPKNASAQSHHGTLFVWSRNLCVRGQWTLKGKSYILQPESNSGRYTCSASWKHSPPHHPIQSGRFLHALVTQVLLHTSLPPLTPPPNMILKHSTTLNIHVHVHVHVIYWTTQSTPEWVIQELHSTYHFGVTEICADRIYDGETEKFCSTPDDFPGAWKATAVLVRVVRRFSPLCLYM